MTNKEIANQNATITISVSSSDADYNELTQEVSVTDLPPANAYSIHVHNAKTPEPEAGSTRVIRVWFTLEPRNPEVPTSPVYDEALSDITINYTIGGGSATLSEDYTADTTVLTSNSDSNDNDCNMNGSRRSVTSSAGTVIILEGESCAYIDIPILVDTTSNADTGDETFLVTIASASGGAGETLELADTEATATIGEPNETSFYFFPNRPLVDGDAAFFECYVRQPTTQAFDSSIALISFDGSTPAGTNDININDVTGIDTTRYTASFASLLLGVSSTRAGVQLVVSSYLMSQDAPSSTNPDRFACHGVYLGAIPSDAIISGSFGTVEFGQVYE